MLAPHLLAPTTPAIKRRPLPTGWISACVVLLALFAWAARPALATNGTWIDATSGGLWSGPGHWSGGTIADGQDAIADFSTLDITTDNTVHLNSARTIGQLLFGDTNPTNNWILDDNGNASNTLTFSVSSGNPQIVVNNQTATLNLGIIGTNVVTSGAGTLVISGATDNTGLGLTVTAGTTVLGKTSSSGVHAIGGGGLTVNGGIAQLGGSGGDQIYDSANVTVNSGAFDTNGLTEQFNSLSLEGTGIAGAGALVNSAPGGSIIFLFGTTTLTGDATIGVTQSSGSLTLATSSISGGFGITKVGSGTLNLINNFASTFTGATNVNDGTLLLNGGIVAISDTLNIGDGIGAPGSAAVVATSATRQFPLDLNVTIRSDGVLNDQDSNEEVNALTMTGGSVIGTGVLVFGGPSLTTQSSPMTAAISVTTVYLNGPNQRFTVAQGTTASGIDLDVSSQLFDTMGGSSTVIKAGAGTMRLTGNNMFTGGVTLNAGTLIIGNNNALGTGTLTAGGGALAADTNGPYIVTNAVNLSNTLTVSGVGNLTLAGPISGSGGLTKTGFGTLTLSGVESFTGPININGGTLAMNTSLASNVTNSATFVYNSGTFGGQLANLGTATFNADFTAGNGMENDGNTSIATGVNMTLNGAGLNNQGSMSMTGGTLTLSVSGTNVNGGSLSLASPARLNLTGATLTNSGMLSLNGGLVNGAGGTLVNAVGGSVSGTGTINCTFNNSGGLVEVGSGAMNVTQGFNNNGVIQLTAFNSALTGGAITSSGTINGFGSLSNSVVNAANGTVEAIGGILNLNGAVQNQAGALLTATSGNKLLITQGLGTTADIINLAGGTFDNNGFALNNTGQISGWGVFRTGSTGLDNHGSITFSGGTTTVNGPVTNENGKSIVVAYNPAIFTGLVTNNGGGTFNIVSTTAVFAGGSSGSFSGTFTNNASSAFAVGGSGVLEVDGAPTLGAASSMAVGGTSTLRFKPTTGAAAVGVGVTATVASGATLELAGSVSSLSSGANRVNITNNSSSPGILVSGTNQQVGNIDGAGTTQVNAGSDLTANHIVQSALVIGGTAGSPATVTIAASDASGNPLDAARGGPRGQSSDFALADSMTASGPLGASATSTANLSSGDSTDLAALSPDNSAAGSDLPPVPEPSTLLLVLLAVFAATSRRIALRWRDWRNEF